VAFKSILRNLLSVGQKNCLYSIIFFNILAKLTLKNILKRQVPPGNRMSNKFYLKHSVWHVIYTFLCCHLQMELINYLSLSGKKLHSTNLYHMAPCRAPQARVIKCQDLGKTSSCFILYRD
jgi:hypothetical protein